MRMMLLVMSLLIFATQHPGLCGSIALYEVESTNQRNMLISLVCLQHGVGKFSTINTAGNTCAFCDVLCPRDILFIGLIGYSFIGGLVLQQPEETVVQFLSLDNRVILCADKKRVCGQDMLRASLNFWAAGLRLLHVLQIRVDIRVCYAVTLKVEEEQEQSDEISPMQLPH